MYNNNGFDCLCFVLGEIIRIVIEDYVQHLSGYNFKLKFDPTLMHGSSFQYGNRIAMEFAQLYHWHPLMPDSFLIDGDEINYPDFMFNTSILLHYGLDKLIHSFTRQQAGQVRQARAGWLRFTFVSSLYQQSD